MEKFKNMKEQMDNVRERKIKVLKGNDKKIKKKRYNIMIYPRYTRLFQHYKISLCHLSCQRNSNSKEISGHQDFWRGRDEEAEHREFVE